MGHTNRWCPVVSQTIEVEDRTIHQPCPFCGTRLPADYVRVEIDEDARRRGSEWLRDQSEDTTDPAPETSDVPPSDPPIGAPTMEMRKTEPPPPLPPPAPASRSAPIRLILFAVFVVFSLVRGFLFPGDPTLDDLSLGDCFNDPTEYSDALTEVESVELVDCDEEHLYEYIGSYTSSLFATSATYPSGAELAVEAFKACGDRAENYSGVPYGQAFLDVVYYTPLPDDWSKDRDSTVICAVHTIEPATESVENRGPELLLGCFSWEDTGVECTEPHGFEQYAFGWHPDGPGDPYPGDSAVQGWADELCASHFESYSGAPASDPAFSTWWLAPDEGSWQDSHGLVQCFVAMTNGDDMVGSVSSHS